MSNLDLRIAEIMHGDTEVLKIMKGDIKKWPLSTYTITTTLTNITSDAPTTILENSSLVVNLSVNTGHYMDDGSVVVMMGSTDITSTAYSNGVVSIASVTGNVSITANTMFDAQVEYLQGDGTAYIDTGVETTNAIRTHGELTIMSSATTTVGVFGARSSSSTNQNCMLWYPNNGWIFRYAQYSTYFSNTNVTGDYILDNSTATRIMNISGAASGTYTFTSSSFTTTLHYFLFAVNNNGSPMSSKGHDMQIKAWKIYSSSTVVRNFIPVRKNGVGYLYDKKTNTLYGNVASSGAFTYGNDV